MPARTEELTAAHKRLLAYAHPLREKIFTILAERSASPSELTRALGLPRKDLGNVDFHTKKLVELDCAEVVGERPGRGSLTVKIYKATDQARVETAEWDRLLEENPAFAKYIVNRGMQVLVDDFTLAGRAGLLGDDSDFHMSRTPRIVDAEGLAQMLKLNERHREEKDQIELEAAERRREDGSDSIAITDGLLLFRVPSARDSSRARDA